jgi:hypothetical protein
MHGLHIQRTCFLILAFIFATFLPLLLHPLSKSSNCYCPLSALLFYSLQILRYTFPVPHLRSYMLYKLDRTCFLLHRLYLCFHLSTSAINSSKFLLGIQDSAFIPFVTCWLLHHSVLRFLLLQLWSWSGLPHMHLFLTIIQNIFKLLFHIFRCNHFHHGYLV